jgi:hypothetical protein
MYWCLSVAKTIKIIVETSEADFERVLQAFKDGKLKDLGVLNIRSVEDGQTQWTDPNLKRRGKPTDKPGRDAPPTRS